MALRLTLPPRSAGPQLLELITPRRVLRSIIEVMLDPNLSEHGDYYLVAGDFTGSWSSPVGSYCNSRRSCTVSPNFRRLL